jgi:DNA invertase Pin-like site-specific DNA recombinase
LINFTGRSDAVNVIGYLRVSTEEQARSGLGLAAQRATITAEAKRRGWRVTWLVDRASARTLDRPALHTALEQLRAGAATALVVAKLDRLSRSLPDFAHTMEQARKQGWALVALDLGVDTTTPAGELVANVMAAVAQWERRIIGARTSEALKARKAKGLPVGRPACVTPERIDQLVALRESGMAFSAIARHLNDLGEPTATGNGRWTGTTVARMLRAGGE